MRLFTTVIVSMLILGCVNNYEMKETGGKLYRLNKKTGDIDLVSGECLIRLKNRKQLDSISFKREFDSLWNNTPSKLNKVGGDTLTETEIVGKDTLLGLHRYKGGDPTDSLNWELSPIVTNEDRMLYENEVKNGKYITPWRRFEFRKKYNY